ncbi:MAG: hypothetical protein HQ559_01010 [Lentisphaerae bacterium]|nr:hypothetical protein [Lentisphaerota bacterium]
MGQYNTSRTRVQPVFSELITRMGLSADWLPALLSLLECGAPDATVTVEPGPVLKRQAWGGNPASDEEEQSLSPPLSLLSWLVRNLVQPEGINLDSANDVDRQRQKLIDQDPETIARALEMLKRHGGSRKWYVLEGPSQPDVYLETEKTIIVIEGKGTESGPTTNTTWMAGRHQVLRYIDAAWEIRGSRDVYGFFIVNGKDDNPESTEVPDHWRNASKATWSDEAISSSLPHRGPEEQHAIRNAFLGITTWQSVCQKLALKWPGQPRPIPADN